VSWQNGQNFQMCCLFLTHIFGHIFLADRTPPSTVLHSLRCCAIRDLRPVYSDTTQLKSTDLLRADWLYTLQLGQLHCRSPATVELRRWGCLATQLNSTELNWTQLDVELSCVAINGPLDHCDDECTRHVHTRYERGINNKLACQIFVDRPITACRSHIYHRRRCDHAFTSALW